MLELNVIGFFRLPRGQQSADESVPAEMRYTARFGFGGRAMCMHGSGELVISGHGQADLVGAVNIPEPSLAVADAITLPFPDATLSMPFFEVTPGALLSLHKLNTLVGLEYHEGKLYALWQEYYDVDGKDGGRASLWDGDALRMIGDGEIKKTSGYLASYGGQLWCGRSHGAGNAAVPHGPQLQHTGADLPVFHDPRPDWNGADEYTALVFLPGHVCWLVSKAIGPVWYGSRFGPNGEKDPWNRSKGYHTTERVVWLMPYTWPELERLSPIRLGEFEGNSACGGVAYDAERRRLYVHELWPPKTMEGVYTGEQPRIHVYDVDTDDGKPEPPDEPEREFPEVITVRFTLNGEQYAGDLEREDE